MGESSNDVIPTAIHVAVLGAISKNLVPALTGLHDALKQKAAAFNNIVKIGRTHLNDATPIRLGQEFSGYARQIKLAIERIRDASKSLQELALGGTAGGTGFKFASGICCPSHQSNCGGNRAAISRGRRITLKLRLTRRRGSCERRAQNSGGELIKIANDLRWLASGPRCAIGDRPARHPARIVDHAGQSKPGY